MGIVMLNISISNLVFILCHVPIVEGGGGGGLEMPGDDIISNTSLALCPTKS